MERNGKSSVNTYRVVKSTRKFNRERHFLQFLGKFEIINLILNTVKSKCFDGKKNSHYVCCRKE